MPDEEGTKGKRRDERHGGYPKKQQIDAAFADHFLNYNMWEFRGVGGLCKSENDAMMPRLRMQMKLRTHYRIRECYGSVSSA
jgi:hypothetical protein